MYKAVILPLAKEDIKAAADWYDQQQKGLGRRFTKEVRGKVNYIKENPKTIAIRYDETRTAVLNVFPFMIHFDINHNKKTVLISAVLHTSRNPDNWKKRK